MAIGGIVAKLLASYLVPKLTDAAINKISDSVKEKVAAKKLDELTDDELQNIFDAVSGDLTDEEKKKLAKEIATAQKKDAKSKDSERKTLDTQTKNGLKPYFGESMDIYKKTLRKKPAEFVVQDIALPFASKGLRTAGQVFTGTRGLLGQALQAVAGTGTPAKAKELYGNDILETAATIANAKAQVSPLITAAVTNAVADTIDHANQAYQADDTRAETMAYQYLNPSNTGYYQYLNKLTSLSNDTK